MDKRTCGYHRLLEAINKFTEHLETLVKRALAFGIKAEYILMDSFKMMKHHLNLEKEAQLRDYDGIVCHTTIAMIRYVFLAVEQRCHDDQRTIGGLFFACSEEIKDLSLMKALQRLLVLALDKVSSSGAFAEYVVIAMIDAIMGSAIEFIQSSRRLAKSTALISIS